MKRRNIILALMISAAMCLSGCGGESFKRGEETEYSPSEPERYSNHIEIEGQWGASAATGPDGNYGIGDPFVMRYNGKYYLYPSTSDPCDGIKVFESDDMIHWTDKGYAVATSEPTVHGAYAPEVVYYNGSFYMCQSRAGKGHYIYKSSSPTEGFTLVSKSEHEAGTVDYGNLGMGIDGSFYVSDDGKLYIMHTSSPAGLKFNLITDTDNICPDTLSKPNDIEEANLRHWIEGPGIFRRGQVSYLTYTGNHVISKGYRIAYSYAENLASLGDFIQPKDNVTIIDTHAEHYGLGHSSNVTGRDLDSVYTAYHSLVGNGPARRFNLDRYLTSGSLLTANGVTHRPVAVPSLPAAQARDGSELAREGDIYAVGKSGDYFTAEYNIIPESGNTALFGYDGGSGYGVKVTANSVSLVKTGGGESVIGSASVNIPADKLVCVRVENGDGVGYVYLNGMRLIEYKASAASGYIGYTSDRGVYYTAFSDDVFGTSDFEALKNFPARIPATAYLKGENRGFSIRSARRVSGGIRVGEKESTLKVEGEDSYAVSLGSGDWVKYGVDIGADDTYLLSARVTARSGGAQLKVTVGESELSCTLPAYGGEDAAYNIPLGRMDLKAGIGAMRVEVTRGSADIIWIEATDEAADNATVGMSDFEIASGSADISDGCITVRGGDVPGAALWGNRGVADFEAKVTFECTAGHGSDLGFMLRASNYSYYPDQPRQSWRGYYLQVGSQLLSLNRYDYGDEMMAVERMSGTLDGVHELTVTASGNTVTAVLDGKVTVTAADGYAFTHGKFGVYVSSGEIKVTAFEYKSL